MMYKIKPLKWLHNTPPSGPEWWTTFGLGGEGNGSEMGTIEVYLSNYGGWKITGSSEKFENAEDAKEVVEDNHTRLLRLFLEETP